MRSLSMRTFFFALCLAAAPMAMAQTTRPEAPVANDALIVPGTPPPPRAAPAQPAPPPQVQRPAEFGKFKPIPVQPPEIGALFAARSVEVRGARNAPATRWTYAVYEPGGAGPIPNRAAVLLVPEGQDPVAAVRATDLRAVAREAGWKLIVLPTPQTARPTSGTAEQLADAQRARLDDGGRLESILAAVLSQEGAFGSPAIVSTEGTGDALLSLLCGRTGRGPAPSHAVVLGGALDTQAAAACQPSRVPALLAARATSDTASPYGGGAQPASPGVGAGSTILSAAATRGLWAMLARCTDTQPSLLWLPATRGRLALETHSRCSAGGPVSMLSALDGAALPKGEELTAIVGGFLGGGQ